MKSLFAAFCLALWISLCPAIADVKPSGLFGDHMVLQRDAAVAVFGSANAGEKVVVEFGGKTKNTTADANGKWMVKLDAMAASSEPREMTVSGAKNPVTFKDVLVGEVWLAGGQSNMGFGLGSAHNAAAVLPSAGDSQLRLYKVPLRTAPEPLADVAGQWNPSTPDTAKTFSAVAWFFGHELRQSLGCPVGLIAAPWGGTPIETWISLAALQQDPPVTATLKEWDQAVEQYHRVQADPQLEKDYLADLQRWKKEVGPAYNAAVKQYLADKAAGKPVGTKPAPARPEPTNPDPMGMPSPSRRPSTPSISFNAMIAPLAPYTIRGVIWYQGEANGSRGMEYRTLFPRMIQGWRSYWGSEFPFLFVQLPANGPDEKPVAENGWPWTREAQFMALRLANTAMAVTIDVGNPRDVHPTDKVDVAHRLALLARRDVYGDKVVASGPLYKSFAVEGNTIRVRFTDIGGGLTSGQSPWLPAGVEPLPTDHLIGFYIAGPDRKWVEADAKIDGDSVIVSSPAASNPVAVRYGWANSPRCNLYNKQGLPAAPFRTDDWEK